MPFFLTELIADICYHENTSLISSFCTGTHHWTPESVSSGSILTRILRTYVNVHASKYGYMSKVFAVPKVNQPTT
jgi:hypothetical protein